MTDWPEGRFGGKFVVLAIPLTDVQSTLDALLQTEALISLAVVAATVVLALVIIEIGLPIVFPCLTPDRNRTLSFSIFMRPPRP